MARLARGQSFLLEDLLEERCDVKSGKYVRRVALLIPCLAFVAVLVPSPVFPASPAASPEQEAVLDQLKALQAEMKGLHREQAIFDKLQVFNWLRFRDEHRLDLGLVRKNP